MNVRDIEVYLVRDDSEMRPRWERAIRNHHYLGFRRLAGCAIRHVAVLNGEWLACLGWQSAAYQCKARDDYIGWTRQRMREGRSLIANNGRFCIRPDLLGVKNLASRVLGRSVQRLVHDWMRKYGARLELVETFVDPLRFTGACYVAAGWHCVGVSTAGSVRSNGKYVKGGHPKYMFIRPLRRSSLKILRGEK